MATEAPRTEKGSFGSNSAAERRAGRRRMMLSKQTPKKSDFSKNSTSADKIDRVGSPLVRYFEEAAISAPPKFGVGNSH